MKQLKKTSVASFVTRKWVQGRPHPVIKKRFSREA
jgi:hypothetical protein